MLLRFMLLLCCGIGCVACDGDDASDDRYYVRYSVVGESEREFRMGFADESGDTRYVIVATREGALCGNECRLHRFSCFEFDRTTII